MNKDAPFTETEQVACDVCLKEVPQSEAISPEAGDYVAHFCGLACYEKWQKQNITTNLPAEDTSSSA